MKTHSIKSLFWPIFFELLFLILAGVIDTLMLSTLNDQAVGAVGTTNTYLYMILIMFSVISTGVIAVMTQYIGAGKNYVAKQAKNIGLLLNIILGFILSLILILGSKKILILLGIADSLLEYSVTYMTIVGGSSIVVAIVPIYSNYLRSFGHTKKTMFATITSNLCNFILNGIFLFVFNMGVAGVALATVIARILHLILLIIFAEKNIKFENNKSDISNKEILKQIIKVGIPSAAESALYEISMALVISLFNKMDAEGINVTTRAYVTTITNFSCCTASALAQANCILLGWNIGQGNIKKCYTETAKVLKNGLIINTLISLTLILLGKPLMSIFTDNSIIINLAVKLLIIDLFLGLGRVTNLIFANALKTAGDAYYIVIVATFVMFIASVGGTYFLGLKLEWFAIGAYISMALDEIIRGIISAHRFFSRHWETKTLIKRDCENSTF